MLFKKFRCFIAENLGSVGQWAAKLPAIKLSEWLDRDRESNPSRLADWGRGRPADFFLRPPTLTASNFAALWPTDPKFLALKDLNLLKKHTKNQVASSILKVVFAFSKWPHLHRAYLLASRLIWPALYLCKYGTTSSTEPLTYQGRSWHGFDGFGQTHQFLEKGSRTHHFLSKFFRNPTF